MRGALLIVATAVAACGPTPQELTARQLTTFAAQRDGKIEICKQTFPADKPLSPRIACILSTAPSDSKLRHHLIVCKSCLNVLA